MYDINGVPQLKLYKVVDKKISEDTGFNSIQMEQCIIDTKAGRQQS